MLSDARADGRIARVRAGARDSDWETRCRGAAGPGHPARRAEAECWNSGRPCWRPRDGTIAGLLGASPGASTAVSGDARRAGALLSPSATSGGCRGSRRWCRRWARSCPTSRRFSRRCGRRTRVLRLGGPSDDGDVAPAHWSKDLDTATALRIAQAAGRGVRRRTGHRVPRNSTAVTYCRRRGTSGWRVPEVK